MQFSVRKSFFIGKHRSDVRPRLIDTRRFQLSSPLNFNSIRKEMQRSRGAMAKVLFLLSSTIAFKDSHSQFCNRETFLHNFFFVCSLPAIESQLESRNPWVLNNSSCSSFYFFFESIVCLVGFVRWKTFFYEWEKIILIMFLRCAR